MPLQKWVVGDCGCCVPGAPGINTPCLPPGFPASLTLEIAGFTIPLTWYVEQFWHSHYRGAIDVTCPVRVGTTFQGCGRPVKSTLAIGGDPENHHDWQCFSAENDDPPQPGILRAAVYPCNFLNPLMRAWQIGLGLYQCTRDGRANASNHLSWGSTVLMPVRRAGQGAHTTVEVSLQPLLLTFSMTDGPYQPNVGVGYPDVAQLWRCLGLAACDPAPLETRHGTVTG